MKTPLEIRPVHHRLEDRVRAHVFLCMLACYVQFELTRRLAPMLFTDDTPLAPADPVAPARRSPGAATKAGAPAPPTGTPSTASKTAQDLAPCAATRSGSQQQLHFARLTTPTDQNNAFELIGVKPGK